ncbi:hypothetical protein [Streptomyces sedi]|uniref:Uncharacterized protein n=1 Tax=Streptomyces sedi TaxID=555059 RepID=A0A5C4V367_9ACTN|nr:hypothetical protein [Streptomyces sedi]TNM29856.1 hypothetical protein FH715_14045 [Streptomyces sedi]
MTTKGEAPEPEAGAKPDEPATPGEVSTEQPAEAVSEGAAEPDGDPEDDLDVLLDGVATGAVPVSGVFAPGAIINYGSVEGDQHVSNTRGARQGRRASIQEGPIFAEEILEAQHGFAEPEWFAHALRRLDTGLLVLSGAPGAGRRTAALNLLHRHCGSMTLRAVDGTVDLSRWHPSGQQVRGYLVDGLSVPRQLLEGWRVNQLISRLRDAEARMVIVIPDAHDLHRDLKAALRHPPLRCVPPPASEVFQARLAARIPHDARRQRLLDSVGGETLKELLAQQLAPRDVVELVEELASGNTDGRRLRERMSFLAEEEARALIQRSRESSGDLAFLLATSVFEGLDYRVVREEADRLLELADGRLDHVIPGSRQEEESRPNPQYVLNHSLRDLTSNIDAEVMPAEVNSAAGYDYAVEPVRFARHGQAEAVLRHVWRQYGQMARLITEWLEKVPGEKELVRPVGRTMGMAAQWGGGRRALAHISTLAKSERRTSQQIAAVALGIASDDPVLAGEIRYRLAGWSGRQSAHVRSTVALTCASPYGIARPRHALRLLGDVLRGTDAVGEYRVTNAVVVALSELFRAGNQTEVLERLSSWAEIPGDRGTVALTTFTRLIHQDTSWFSAQLVEGGESAERVITLVHRGLNEEEHFHRTAGAMLTWCRVATWDDRVRLGVEALLSALSHGMYHGVFRLFVTIDRHEDPALAGKAIAHQALVAWRQGEPQPGPTTDESRSTAP